MKQEKAPHARRFWSGWEGVVNAFLAADCPRVRANTRIPSLVILKPLRNRRPANSQLCHCSSKVSECQFLEKFVIGCPIVGGGEGQPVLVLY